MNGEHCRQPFRSTRAGTTMILPVLVAAFLCVSRSVHPASLETTRGQARVAGGTPITPCCLRARAGAGEVAVCGALLERQLHAGVRQGIKKGLGMEGMEPLRHRLRGGGPGEWLGVEFEGALRLRGGGVPRGGGKGKSSGGRHGGKARGRDADILGRTVGKTTPRSRTDGVVGWRQF
jgi:hypothetical protein